MTLPDPPLQSLAEASAPAWLKPLRDWPAAALQVLEREPAVARVVIAQARGSVPRDAGVCMLVSASGLLGTIGGGQLEWQAVAAARALLDPAREPAQLQHFTLATDLGQCCGGVVDVWLERYTHESRGPLRRAQAASARGAALWRSALRGAVLEHEVLIEADAAAHAAALLRAPRAAAVPQLSVEADGQVVLLERLDEILPALWIYGAGHVGQALARIAADLPVRLTWIDPRGALLPAVHGREATVLEIADPAPSVARAPAGTYFVVLTHSHSLDYQLCREILKRADQAWIGVIGSRSKAARFRSRLLREGFSAAAVAQLVCPMGVPGIASKWPAAIAVSVATQLLAAMSRPVEPIAATPQTADCGRSECSTCQPRSGVPK
ncbi:MAG: xanthine dehydrogenase accessory protein XdhC [Steroidobacteraceae bacterium]|jgi:xanthine dehydrogenase accessory factor